MPLLTCTNLTFAYGAHHVLTEVTLAIEPGDRVGLIGRNGCGKTTLLRVMQGSITPDAGGIQIQKNTRIGYLSQDPDFDPTETVRDAAEGAFAMLHQLHGQLNERFEQMATAEGVELDKLLRAQATLETRIEAAGGYAIDHRIDATLHGVGITDDQFTLKVSDLSGGQKGRLGLARLLLEQPDLLLLDEPTNHLDIDGCRWLEQFLTDEYAGAVVVVSHDRWLLDRVVHRMIEVERGRVWEYPGNYHKYLELREERQLTHARVYQKQLDRIRSEEQFISRYKSGQRAKQAKGRQSRLDRYKRDELVENPSQVGVMKLNLPAAPRSGEQVIVAENISKAYDDNVLFHGLDLSIMRGDRVGVIGPNGCGKTTLIRCLLGDLELDSGSVRRGSRLGIGYYRQLHEHLDLSLNVWQYLQSVLSSIEKQTIASEQQARNLAGAFLFSGDEQDKTLGEMSGGERSRVVLAGLVGGGHNLLVLDEPSNHLDIPSAERLEQALSGAGGYDGTLLLITHDRALLEATCDKLIVFDSMGGAFLFQGRFSQYMERREARRGEDRSGSTNRVSGNLRSSKPRVKSQRSYSTTGQTESKKSFRALETRIEKLEAQLVEIDQQLLDPAVYTDGEKCRDIKQRRKEIESELHPLEQEWTQRAESG